MAAASSIIAIVGSSAAAPAGFDAPVAPEALAAALAKAGFRILVCSSGSGFPESPIVKGYAASPEAREKSIHIRYPLDGTPEFPRAQKQTRLVDPRPDHIQNCETSFYLSLSEVEGILAADVTEPSAVEAKKRP